MTNSDLAMESIEEISGYQSIRLTFRSRCFCSRSREIFGGLLCGAAACLLRRGQSKRNFKVAPRNERQTCNRPPPPTPSDESQTQHTTPGHHIRLRTTLSTTIITVRNHAHERYKLYQMRCDLLQVLIRPLVS